MEQLDIYLQPRDEKSKQRYSNPDNDPRGPWVPSDLSANGKGDRLTESCIFPIVNPNNKKEYLPPENKCWLYNKHKVQQYVDENRIGFRAQTGTPFLKRYLSEVRDGVTLATIIDSGGFSQDSAKEIKELFDTDVFEFPKPTSLLKKLINCGFKTSGIILDFFAGSATTAHAILDLNNQDGGNRKFILVQLPEPCAEGSEAFKSGYKTIADIGKERIRRVIKKLNEEQTVALNLDNTATQDRGFKVLKLDKSNFKQWQKLASDTKPEQIEEQINLHIDHIDHRAAPEDLLFEILIKEGFTPTEKVLIIQLAGLPVFSIAEGAFLLCLADTVTKELINAVAEAEPMRFVCLDKAFGGNDQLKANAVQTFAARNMGREKANQIVFKTV